MSNTYISIEDDEEAGSERGRVHSIKTSTIKSDIITVLSSLLITSQTFSNSEVFMFFY